MSFLTTAIKGLPFLGRSSIHIDHFDIDEVLKEKWLQIANVDNFTSLGITYNNEEVKDTSSLQRQGVKGDNV